MKGERRLEYEERNLDNIIWNPVSCFRTPVSCFHGFKLKNDKDTKYQYV